jgi:hypothetical protein
VNVRDPDGAGRWAAAGTPAVPSLLLGGRASPILHVSQLASMLGFDAPPQLVAARLAWDAAAVLEAWVALIAPLDLETLVAPTPSRGRTLRNLTVNVFHPFELLPAAFDAGSFPWDPDGDDDREGALADRSAIVAYAAGRSLGWRDWLLEREPDLGLGDPLVSSPRGEVSYTNLLAAQRWHAAFHYRQLVAFLGDRGHDTTGTLSLASLGELELPAEIF